MMEIEKLRKADIFSGLLVVLLGLFIIGHALQMPMTDSYGGVQNVWYVSPALFPLLVGGMLVLLGILLMKTALKTIGLSGVQSVFKFVASPDFLSFLKQQDSIRFYGIVLNLLFFVFLLVPRVDFFLAAILFLLVFFSMFYCGTQSNLLHLIWLVLAGALVLGVFIFSGLPEVLGDVIPFSADLLVILMIAGLCYYTARQVSGNPELVKKFRLGLVIAFVAPFTIGIIFKFFLLVPMPFEGLVVSVLDAIWYADFWS